MPIRHVDKFIEAYLDNQLSPKIRTQVENHLQECPLCTDHLYEAKRLRRELGPVLRITLGQPAPPSRLHLEVKQALREQASSSRFRINWVAPVRVFGAVGNMALMAALAFGAFVVIRGYIPGVDLLYNLPIDVSSRVNPLSSQLVPTPILMIDNATKDQNSKFPKPGEGRNTLGDTLKNLPNSLGGSAGAVKDAPAKPDAMTITEVKGDSNGYHRPMASGQDYGTADGLSDPALPSGTIAYALYDPTPGIEAFRTYFISPDGSNLRQYALIDVSEPALSPKADNDYPLAVRTWEEKSNPRTILTTDFPSRKQTAVAKYWEDAQADWSPTENRIIFASQRESDRIWRLYTAWGDGSREDNLSREGQSPTFAPDGKRFAFESCDKYGTSCGLWVGHLYDSPESGYGLILEDRSAKSPDWSPVDEKIVYMSNPHNNWDLFMVNSDGSNVQQLTDDPAIDGLPAWSPDGDWVAFISNRGDEWGLWILHVASGELHQTVTFENGYLIPEDRRPYNEHGKRSWLDEQISWSSN
ncbi:MAG TPA: zf-HC2 domain-containing protein [Anaerolineae bacterium]|nr:zf-HC2 domain-containing protein [Anaerolineae bacterium]